MKTTTRRGANHPLHATLTVFTCGLWGIVWIVAAIVGRKTTVTYQVPQYLPQRIPWPTEGPLCAGCGDPVNNGRQHGVNQGYGGCV